MKLRVHAIWIAALLFAGGAATTLIYRNAAHMSREIWRAPDGESIRYIRTYTGAGHVLVATQQDQHWRLRDVSQTGESRLLVEGTGELISVVPMSALSNNRDRLLISLRDTHGSRDMTLLECDLVTCQYVEIAGSLECFGFMSRQPYSVDDSQLLIAGLDPRWPRRVRQTAVGIWCVDRADGQAREVVQDIGFVDAGWLTDDTIYRFVRHSGELFTGPPAKLKLTATLHPAGIASVSPDGRFMITVQDKDPFEVRVTDLATDDDRVVCRGHSWVQCWDIEWSPDGKHAAISANGPKYGTVILGPEWHATELPYSETRKCSAGVAFLRPGVLAVVEMKDDRECIVSIPTESAQ